VYRALDRALPKLKPGRSFKVCLLPQGQDPDDMLREKGALALREALLKTRPFVEVLFERERDLAPLETPEHKAGLKQRLKALAGQIEDKDLAQAYRQDLLERLDALFGRTPLPQFTPQFTPRTYVQRRPGERYKPFVPPMVSTPEGVKAADALARALDPVAAALAQGLLDNLAWCDDKLEALDTYGLGDQALDPLVKALLSLSFSHAGCFSGLDRQVVNRHLNSDGLGALLGGIQKAALSSGAPFLAPDITPENAHRHWLSAFDAMARLTSLDRGLFAAKVDALQHFDAEFFSRLKRERDALRKSLKSGQVWEKQIDLA
jgi:DNA primase